MVAGNLTATMVAQTVKNLPATRETWVQFLGWEHPLKKEMATHSSILAWRIPWTEESSGLQSVGLQIVGHDWAIHTHTHTHTQRRPYLMGFPGDSWWRICLPKQKTRVWSLGGEDPLEEEAANHSSILTWEIPWTEEPCMLQSMGSPKSWILLAGHDLEIK